MSEYVFKLPDLGEGMVESEIAEWIVKVGDFVQEEDPIGTMLTDKAAVELSAPVSGRVVSLAGEIGDMIAVGAAMIVFDTDDSQATLVETAVSETVVSQTTVSETTGSAPSVPGGTTQLGSALPAAGNLPIENTPVEKSTTQPQTGKVLTSPSVRQHAREADIDLTRVSGSGPRGRILRSDLEAYLANKVTASENKATASGREAGQGHSNSPQVQQAPSSQVTEIKVIGLRRIISERMSEANREIPHFAYVEEIDITALESLRQHLNSRKDAAEDKLTLLPFIGLALARVLEQFPQCNALYDRERNVISQHHAVHLGIATQTPNGLKVPVVKHSEGRSLNDLAGEIRRVAKAARENTAKREELMGSTITITSLGKHGGIVTTPVINSPEVAIIGVNKAVERPVVVNGQIVIRLMMNLSSSFDHRFVDGFDAAMMIQALKDLLEQPATIFISE